MKFKLEILFEDEDLLLVNKPSGVLSIPDRYGAGHLNLLHLLENKYGKVYTVHRLDRETSGIICFARNETAHRIMSMQFQKREVEKYYLTLLDGQLVDKEGIIDKPIAPHPSIASKMHISAKGKSAITHFKLIELFKHFSLVEANIKTGRTHQIRVHFEALGYPLAIDKVYGRRSEFYVSQIKRKYRRGKDKEERPLMTRSILHAHRLVIKHPTSGETHSFEAPLHKDFNAVLKQLRKWDKD